MSRMTLMFACALLLLPILMFPIAPLAAEPTSGDEVAAYAARLLAENYDADGPGAALLVTRGDEVLYRGAAGSADIAGGEPLTADGLFRIGSITKQFAAAAVLRLVEDGKVGLDDPLGKYVPDYPGGEHVTVRQLLNHTSGIKSYTDIPGMMEGPIQRDVTTAQLIDGFKDETPDFAPGEGWNYSNSGYVLVGAVIEAASGMPWHRYLDQTFFQPLGMHDTGYGADPAFVARQAHGYTWDGGKAVDAKPISMTQPHAAGALVSTVDDLQRWNRALHEGKVLSDASYRQMITPTGKAVENDYGFGIGTGTVRNRPTLIHGGGIFGFSTSLTYAPDEDIGVVVLQNVDGSKDDRDGPGEIGRRVMAVALGDPYPAVKAVPMDAESLKQYEGVYRIDADTTRVLRVVDGRLTGQRSGGQRALLTPIAKDSFLYADGFNRFDIVRDAGGGITGMRFYQSGEGEGVVAALSEEPLPTLRKSITLPRAALERVTGRYLYSGMAMIVSLDDDTLSAQLGGQPPLVLAAESPDRFYPTTVDATLAFSPSSGTPAILTLEQGGRTLEFKRDRE